MLRTQLKIAKIEVLLWAVACTMSFDLMTANISPVAPDVKALGVDPEETSTNHEQILIIAPTSGTFANFSPRKFQRFMQLNFCNDPFPPGLPQNVF